MSIELRRVVPYCPTRDLYVTKRKTVPAFRPDYARREVTDAIESCCFAPEGFKDFLAEYHTYAADPKWKWKLQSSKRTELRLAFFQPTELEFWDVEGSDNIGATYIMRFENCAANEMQKVQIGNPAEVLEGGNKFRDGDLCYVSQPVPGGFEVFELYYVHTESGRKGFVTLGVHKWVPNCKLDWKRSIKCLVATHNLDWQPGSLKVYQK